ncbi:methyltransferase domain-containing protein [Rossellomorea sp. SC111]|uniref:methyltransferase domain-containing protein n=1 Tax=Rossellomorea sp. SC111 TaxID=2968985 RepID=UPI00215ABFDC|nr:methyltransferase domain-containing protein [Rossellomorea sp. SC111]MCR8847447.1 methyltransferase domain-containing protein [Rossellomorea sp. SC111]
MRQSELSSINRAGWNEGAYQAWVNRHGLPKDYALTLMKNPQQKVLKYLNHMGEIRGKRIANLLGSKGNKAVSLALLGAEVTVVDISKENSIYAMELAAAAGVDIHYIVSDLLEIPGEEKKEDYDFVILELGVLHYFVDLVPVFTIVNKMLKKGGTFILRDFHPMLTKLLSVEGTKMVAAGDYFGNCEIEVDVAFWKLLKSDLLHPSTKNRIRRWTLGDIITAIGITGLTITQLEEEAGIRWAFPANAPLGIENNIPGLFTIIAEKK